MEWHNFMGNSLVQELTCDYVARNVAIGIGWVTFALDAADGTII